MSQENQSSKKIESSHEASTNLYRRPERPQRPEPKPQQVIESTTNEAGEVFKPGDKILVTPPWGGKALAEITSFYLDNSGQAWAHYSPNETRDKWAWESGCIRAALLVTGQAD
ncbi:MAG TPA: hypothetical protein V6C91_13395 [Coleofasciculaceae cyanobacterium]